EISHAKKVVEAFEEASRDGRGVVTVEGRMVENLHRDIALRTLETASQIQALTPHP
ncbi:MAG: putative acyl-CoA lyase, partial [Frankiales bacterium]|nr:putative acyl-CoA lyase [Frankiales bacterium]